MTQARRVNRGPSAAAENHAALIAAARKVFADTGFDAPLSLIARTAGVGQGVLYRHFPDRQSLALAVFEDNIATLEAVAADQDATFDGLVNVVIEQLTRSVGFIEIIDPVTDDPRLFAVRTRVTDLLATKLNAARAAGAVRDDVTEGDLMLAFAMLSTVLARTDAATRPAVAARAWALLLRGLRG